MAETKAQLLGFLLYGTPAFIERLLHAFGAEDSNATETSLAALLPGPHPVLRQLVTLDAGELARAEPIGVFAWLGIQTVDSQSTRQCEGSWALC